MNETRINPTYQKELQNYRKFPILRYHQCLNNKNKSFKPLFDRTKPINKYLQVTKDFNDNSCCLEDNLSLDYHKEFKKFHLKKQKKSNQIQKSILEDYNIMFKL